MQTYLQLNDIKQNLDEKHYAKFLDFIQHPDQRFIENDLIKVLEDKIIHFKNNEYIKIKDNELLNLLNEYVIFEVQNPNSYFAPKEISFLENLGIFPHKMQHHYEILDKLQQFQLLGIKIEYPSEFLSKKLKFPTIDVSQLSIKPLNDHILVAYPNNFNEIEYASKLNPFYINHLTRFKNNKNQMLYFDYLFSKINNTKNLDDETRNNAMLLMDDLKSLYLNGSHKKERSVYSKDDIYIKPSDLFNNYFHQRFVKNEQKKVYNSLTQEDEERLYVLNDFITSLSKNLSDYNEKYYSDPQKKYREIVIKTIKEFEDKQELVKDQQLHQFLKYQLDLDLTKIVKQKEKENKENKTLLEEYA